MKVNTLIKRIVRRGRMGRIAVCKDAPMGRNQTGLDDSKELEKGKDVNLSLSIDSTASSESDDSQTPHLPVLLMGEPSSKTERKRSDDLDFLTALRTS
jgi:hypothetical protein